MNFGIECEKRFFIFGAMNSMKNTDSVRNIVSMEKHRFGERKKARQKKKIKNRTENCRNSDKNKSQVFIVNILFKLFVC